MKLIKLYEVYSNSDLFINPEHISMVKGGSLYGYSEILLAQSTMTIFVKEKVEEILALIEKAQ